MAESAVAVLIAEAKREIEECDLSATEKAMQENSHLLIDVREPEEFVQGHLEGAINVPRGVLEFRTDANYPGVVEKLTDKTAKIILYCRSGGRSALAAQSLTKMGYQSVMSMAGGFMAWEAAKLPVSFS